MAESTLEDLVQQLSDVEVALFLSLAAREHCLIETTADSIHDLANDLALVRTFNGHGLCDKFLTNYTDLLKHFRSLLFHSPLWPDHVHRGHSP